MAESGCGCEGAKDAAQEAAAELYQVAALMLGEETAAAETVESVVAAAKIDPCADAEAALNTARRSLVDAALARLRRSDPDGFGAPAPGADSGCLTDKELDEAGLSSERLTAMLRGPDLAMLRGWLDRLPVAQRVVFVERVALGWTNAEAATSLSRAASSVWSPEQAGIVFHKALCSLASSMVHAATAQA